MSLATKLFGFASLIVDLYKEAQTAFFIKTEGEINRILLSEDGNEDGMGFYFNHRLSPDQKWSVPIYSACRLNDQTLWALAEAPARFLGKGGLPSDRSGA